MKASTRAWVVAALLLVVSGCGDPAPKEGEKVGKLRLGTVDVMRVMEEKPETVQIKLDWATQAGTTYNQLVNAKDKVEYGALQKQIAKQNEAWQKRMDEFMKKSVAEVEVQAEKLAREKGIDVVLVDNNLTKTLKYSDGEDLTTEILIRLQNGGK